MQRLLLAIGAIFIFFSCTDTLIERNIDPLQYVDPFIGTGGHGHTFPGATLPFGMVQLSPDTRLEGWDGCSGYHFTDSLVYGFSHTHLSGTGVSDYGDILLMPFNGEVEFDNGYKSDSIKGYRSSFSKENEKASAGYYSTYLDDYSIAVELTASLRAGFHKYTFDNESSKHHLILDLEHRDDLIDYQIEIKDDFSFEGKRVSKAWAEEQHVYFSAQLSLPIDSYKFNEDKTKVVFSFDSSKEKELLVKVGISACDTKGALNNLNTEIPDWDFNDIKRKAENEWRNELSKILVDGGTDDEKLIFYTALYHTMIAPNIFSDVDGRYRGMDQKIHSNESQETYTVFSLWDTFRALHPLHNIINRKRTGDFIKTFIQHSEQGTKLPVWELAANETECMIGYHSVPVILDAYMKGIRDYDADKALKAMVSTANRKDFGLEAYLEYNYIPSDKFSESVSRTLEYAYDDWCIGSMAELLGDTINAQKFFNRALYYRNIYNPETGFFQAKSNNNWSYNFDPTEVNFNFTEANAWQYSMFAPHDVNGLINLMGGEESFEKHLDEMFEADSETSGRDQADITGLIGQYAHGNEPSHHMAYLYNYVGKPWKTQRRIRQIMDELYTVEPDGLSGNEDCGQMSAWYVMSAMGFYQIAPGRNYYDIGSPIFDRVEIHLENGQVVEIYGDYESRIKRYISSISLNGNDWNHSYIPFDDIKNGGTIRFYMSATPSDSFATSLDKRPSSVVDSENFVAVPFMSAPSQSFYDSMSVELGSIDSTDQIFYRMDKDTFKLYEGAITISKDTRFYAYAQNSKGDKSKTIESSYFLRDEKLQLSIVEGTYSNQYAAGGPDALIDNLRGPNDFKTGYWQGYQGQDVEWVVDLSEQRWVRKAGIGFVQDIQPWIWFPKLVSFEYSTDGKTFKPLKTIKDDFPDDKYGSYTKDYTVRVNKRIRYLKVKAKNNGVCPPWHLGSGGKSWLFADEIFIE